MAGRQRSGSRVVAEDRPTHVLGTDAEDWRFYQILSPRGGFASTLLVDTPWSRPSHHRDARPTTSGWTIAGMPRHTTSSAATSNPQRAHQLRRSGGCSAHPAAKRRHGWNSLSWHAASNREFARTCSMNSNCPSGRSTRAISLSVRSGSGTVQRTSVDTTVSTDASASGRRSAGASTIRAARPCRCRRRASRPAHRGVGLGEHEFGDVVGIMRSVQPGAGADLNDPPAGVAQQRPSPAAQACDLTEPEKGVVYECENPQPCRGRWARRLSWSVVSVMPQKVGPGASRAHRSKRPSLPDGPFRPAQSSPRRAASATAAVREVRPSLRRMFATWR